MTPEISTDKTRLDLDWIVRQLQGSYWGGHFTELQICEAVGKSLCFGAYEDGKQVGFVRCVTDGAIFSSVCDVIVQEDYRGKGIGSALMEAVVKHPEIAPTYCILRARTTAWFWYFRFDFRVFDKAHGLMHRQPQA
jgi:ribosomal protein S18 acetylase RimI-like enzyme